MKSDFLSVLHPQKPLLADGAMGTMLHESGVDFARCFDELNLIQPELVGRIHSAYLDAGADLVMTNTFGANRFRLLEHGLENQVEKINRAGVEIARKAALDSGRRVFVAADVGPLGVRLAPFGRVQPEQARAAFEEQIRGLVAGKPDLIIIETMTDLYEVREAIAAAKAVSVLPVVASMTFTRDDRTLLGDTPIKVARKIHQAGADVIGINCSGGPAQLLRILKQMREVVPDALFSVMPNAGWPEQAGGRIMYPAGPEYFGQYANAFRQAGAALVGGCCGTTPGHIRAMREALDNPPQAAENGNGVIRVMERAEEKVGPDRGSQLAEKLKAGVFVTAVEMDPPRGLSTHKLLAGADLQGDLLAAHALGVRNVFVVMGDPTAIGDYPDAMDNYDLAPTGLIRLIKQGFNTGVDHSGSEIGQPTSFYIGAALNLAPPDLKRESQLLKRKLANGADFFLTQPVYDPGAAKAFLESYAADNGQVEKT